MTKPAFNRRRTNALLAKFSAWAAAKRFRVVS